MAASCRLCCTLADVDEAVYVPLLDTEVDCPVAVVAELAFCVAGTEPVAEETPPTAATAAAAAAAYRTGNTGGREGRPFFSTLDIG